MALFKTNKLMPAAVVLGFLFYGISVGAGFAAEPEEELRQLRQELREHRKYTETLEKRIDQLESKLAAKAATEKDRGFELKDIYDDGFTFRSKDNRFSLTLNGFGQFRYTLSSPETGKTAQTFDVALARLALSGVVFDPRLSYLMQMQGSTLKNTNGVTMLDWWLKYGFAPEFNLQAGRFLLPYSRQYYTHPGNLLFPDLSEADIAFNLPRGIGAQVTGKTGPLSYYVALLNSIRALDASGQQNFNNKLGGLARLEFDILDPYGYLETSPKPVSAPQFSAGLAVAFNPVNEVSAFQHVFPGENTTNVTLDAGFRWQGLTFQGAGYYRVHNTSPDYSWLSE